VIDWLNLGMGVRTMRDQYHFSYSSSNSDVQDNKYEYVNSQIVKL
jgi:hypothetical protein